MMDEEAFTREVRACERMLYRVSRTILASPSDCCDAVQEALLKAWQHRGRVDATRFRAYLTRILINECHNIGRKRARLTVVEEIPERAAPQAERTELRDALARIGEGQRLVLVMHELEGYSLKEIAQALRVPLGTVKWRMARAKRALRMEWTGDEEEGGARV